MEAGVEVVKVNAKNTLQRGNGCDAIVKKAWGVRALPVSSRRIET